MKNPLKKTLLYILQQNVENNGSFIKQTSVNKNLPFFKQENWQPYAIHVQVYVNIVYMNCIFATEQKMSNQNLNQECLG